MVMLEEDLYLAVPTHSPYGDKDSINLADTRNAGYICLAGSRPIRQICNSYFSEADFVPNVIFESDTTESVRNLIAAAALPSMSLSPQIHSCSDIPSGRDYGYPFQRMPGLPCPMLRPLLLSPSQLPRCPQGGPRIIDVIFLPTALYYTNSIHTGQYFFSQKSVQHFAVLCVILQI